MISNKDINEVFNKIEAAKTVSQLRDLSKEYELEFNEVKYPDFRFGSLSYDELKSLTYEDCAPNEDSPIQWKLLYSIVWKQGDLSKLGGIIEGAKSVFCTQKSDEEHYKSDDNKNRLVFFQFGRHLANPRQEPIIDQHTLRAFGKWKGNYSETKTSKEGLKQYISLIIEYKKWYNKAWFNQRNVREHNYKRTLDKLVFSIGKALKNT